MTRADSCRLNSLQYAVDCRKNRQLVVELGRKVIVLPHAAVESRQDGRIGRIDKEVHGFGLGAALHVITAALSYGARYNRTVVMPKSYALPRRQRVTSRRDAWWYTEHSDCSKRSFSCYFQQVRPCQVATADRRQQLSKCEAIAPKNAALLTRENAEVSSFLLQVSDAAQSDARVLYTPTRLDGCARATSRSCVLMRSATSALRTSACGCRRSLPISGCYGGAHSW